jgi:ActR/RegA family two-component response regulator
MVEEGGLMSEKTAHARLLFVEDEEGIRLTLATLLTKNGFDVTTVATVGDALTHINFEKFDVLLSDLNIEKLGDGFVVISAMRYAQPHCVSLVLTAYPSFENAMEAIQHQVDEFFTKPTDINILIEKIKEKLQARRLKIPVPLKRLALVLRENCADILAKLTAALKSDPITSAASSKQGEDRLPKIMDALIEYLDVGRNGLESEALRLSAEHGRSRKKQGYDARMTAREFQLIDEAICEIIAGDKMPAAPVGLTTDLMKLTKGLNALMIAALQPYVGAQHPSSVSSRRTAK